MVKKAPIVYSDAFFSQGSPLLTYVSAFTSQRDENLSHLKLLSVLVRAIYPRVFTLYVLTHKKPSAVVVTLKSDSSDDHKRLC